MQKSARISEISTRVTRVFTFYVQPVCIFDIVQTRGKSTLTQINLENNYGEFRKEVSITLFLIDCMFHRGSGVRFLGVSYTLAVFCVSNHDIILCTYR